MKIIKAKKVKKSDVVKIKVKGKDKYVTKTTIRLKDAIGSSNNIK